MSGRQVVWYPPAKTIRPPIVGADLPKSRNQHITQPLAPAVAIRHILDGLDQACLVGPGRLQVDGEAITLHATPRLCAARTRSRAL